MIRFLVILFFVAIAHIVAFQPSEPFYLSDETRHLMTGTFFHDLIKGGNLSQAKSFAYQYYGQYPALGLLVWPPLFHMVEGAWMAIFGVSVLASKILVLTFLAIACLFSYRVVRLTNSREQALLVTALTAFSPMTFELSGQVMLEVPTLAWAMASIYYFMLYLRSARNRDLVMAAVAAVTAAMTKYDVYYLLILFPLLLIGNNPKEVLKREQVWIVVLLAITAVSPIAYLTVREMGAVHLHSLQVNGTPVVYSNWLYYLLQLPNQLGWPTFVASLIGIGVCIQQGGMTRMRPHLAIIAATYLAFASIGEQELRHTIYWIPAWAAFAGEGIRYLVRPLTLRRRDWVQAGFAAATLLIAVTAPRLYVRGYESAAQFVLQHGGGEKVLFDGYLNGNFIFQMRRYDPDRKSTVIRADKVLYHTVSGYIAVGYEEYVQTDAEILTVMVKNSSRYIVVESRSYNPGLKIANRMRELLHTDTERFRRVAVIPIDTNFSNVAGAQIEIFEQSFTQGKKTVSHEAL